VEVALGRSAQTIVEELWTPMLIGADPRLTERHYSKAKRICPELVRGGCEAQTFAALDIALWDLKSQAADVPLHQLLGGARDAAPVYVADTMRGDLSADQVVELAKPGLETGCRGVWVGVTGRDPVRDAQKLQRVRDELGEEIWFGVCGHHGLDLNTALAFGRFLEEELDADVYADPCPADDLDAYARLSLELELAVAAGMTLGSAELNSIVTRTRVGVVRADLGRIGGITAMIKLAAAAEAHHRILMPIGNAEVTCQLACGLANIVGVDWKSSHSGALSIDKSNGSASPAKSGSFSLRHSGLDA
jgi:L-alanine-DL-glutamate epimerase-like enolase superfamily enzyme